MESKLIQIHPDLIINRESALDRMGATASHSLDTNRPNATKQIQIVRMKAHKLCLEYQNCKACDWCVACASGTNGKPLFLGEACLYCKLLTADARFEVKRRIKVANKIAG